MSTENRTRFEDESSDHTTDEAASTESVALDADLEVPPPAPVLGEDPGADADPLATPLDDPLSGPLTTPAEVPDAGESASIPAAGVFPVGRPAEFDVLFPEDDAPAREATAAVRRRSIFGDTEPEPEPVFTDVNPEPIATDPEPQAEPVFTGTEPVGTYADSERDPGPAAGDLDPGPASATEPHPLDDGPEPELDAELAPVSSIDESAPYDDDPQPLAADDEPEPTAVVTHPEPEPTAVVTHPEPDAPAGRHAFTAEDTPSDDVPTMAVSTADDEQLAPAAQEQPARAEAPRTEDDILLEGSTVVGRLAPRTAAHWSGVLLAVVLLPFSWFFLHSSAAQVMRATQANSFALSASSLVQLAVGAATLVLALWMARRSSLGSFVVGAFTLLLGLPALLAPTLMNLYVTPVLERLTQQSSLGADLASFVWSDAVTGRFVWLGLLLIMVGVVSHSARRAGRREQEVIDRVHKTAR